jgi:hypothetical protein
MGGKVSAQEQEARLKWAQFLVPGFVAVDLA